MIYNFNLIIDKFISELIPLTKKNVLQGNKIFGAFILNKEDYSTVAINSNNEIKNPLLHGEISTINSFFLDNSNIDPKNCIFISSHEPCSLCLSAITWSGFDNFSYFFPYEDTKEKFNIPHDLLILNEVFNIKGGNYNKENKYWKSLSILDEISKLSSEDQLKINNKVQIIKEKYKELSSLYQKNKNNNKIPLN
tara:strand:- start:4955 stop:5536 length:582 start_codon:yes stop_codon:yes gene_type:complete